MSHMTQLELEYNDIAALEKAARKRGLELRHKDRFQWYGEFVGDSNGLVAQGIPVEEWNKCDYALGRKGTTPGVDEYEIGVCATGHGTYKLRLDTWGPGRKLAQVCGGDELLGLADDYTAEVAEQHWINEGYEVTRELQADGSILVVARQ